MGRTLENLDETLRLTADLGGNTWLVWADGAQRVHVEGAAARVVRQGRHMDILVNSPGVQLRKPALEVSEEE